MLHMKKIKILQLISIILFAIIIILTIVGLCLIWFNTVYNINNKNNYLQIDLTFELIICIIVSLVLLCMIVLFITLIWIFKRKPKNNNFWDAIENCEIINNYYIH